MQYCTAWHTAEWIVAGQGASTCSATMSSNASDLAGVLEGSLSVKEHAVCDV